MTLVLRGAAMQFSNRPPGMVWGVENGAGLDRKQHSGHWDMLGVCWVYADLYLCGFCAAKRMVSFLHQAGRLLQQWPATLIHVHGTCTTWTETVAELCCSLASNDKNTCGECHNTGMQLRQAPDGSPAQQSSVVHCLHHRLG